MPMDRSLYPANWEAIALEIKTAAGWKCEQCDRPCRRPGESLEELGERIENDYPEWRGNFWVDTEVEEFGLIEVPHPQRFTLTVAHLDHEPSHCDRANLRALCAPCHCRYDLQQMERKKYLKRERLGQLNLFDLVPPTIAGHGKDNTRIQKPMRCE